MAPTWNRAYVALYEVGLATLRPIRGLLVDVNTYFQQALHAHVLDFARQYDDLTWMNVAHNFRIPYWDIAHPTPLPEVFSSRTVKILRAPQGTEFEIPNPMWGYEFHDVSMGKFDAPWNIWGMTLRCPTANGFNAGSDHGELET